MDDNTPEKLEFKVLDWDLIGMPQFISTFLILFQRVFALFFSCDMRSSTTPKDKIGRTPHFISVTESLFLCCIAGKHQTIGSVSVEWRRAEINYDKY